MVEVSLSTSIYFGLFEPKLKVSHNQIPKAAHFKVFLWMDPHTNWHPKAHHGAHGPYIGENADSTASQWTQPEKQREFWNLWIMKQGNPAPYSHTCIKFCQDNILQDTFTNFISLFKKIYILHILLLWSYILISISRWPVWYTRLF